MKEIISLIQSNNTVITLAAGGVSIITLLLWLINSWRISRMIKRHNQVMRGVDGRNLEEMLTQHMESVNKALNKTREVESAYRIVKRMAEKSIQHVGVVRFNAFQDTGSDLSFAVALLDNHGDGLVISSIFGRNESHTYAKPVIKGTSSYHLSGEEEESIKKALENEIIK